MPCSEGRAAPSHARKAWPSGAAQREPGQYRYECWRRPSQRCSARRNLKRATPFSAGPRCAGALQRRAVQRATCCAAQGRAAWLCSAEPCGPRPTRVMPGRQRRAERRAPCSAEPSSGKDRALQRRTVRHRASSAEPYNAGRAVLCGAGQSARGHSRHRRAEPGSGNAGPSGAVQREPCSARPSRVGPCRPVRAVSCRARPCRTVGAAPTQAGSCSSRLCRATQGKSEGCGQVVQRLGSAARSGAVSSRARVGSDCDSAHSASGRKFPYKVQRTK
ncbi:hypothetical protein APR11_005310 [Nocardia amikacinitolerans]|nr:hypothetical protein [Nocardia amikacinitolerans]